MERWYEQNHDAYMQSRELNEQTSSQLRQSYLTAEADLKRRLASETWLIPERCRNILNELTRDLSDDDGHDWFQHLDTGWHDINQTTDKLRDLVHADLKMASWLRLKVQILFRRFKAWRKSKRTPRWSSQAES